MKFDMGSETLSVLTTQTTGSSDALGALVKQLVVAADPLMKVHAGAAKAAFDGFKGRVDEVAAELDGSLAAVLGGISGMDRAFREGESEMTEQTRGAEGGVAFDAARFSGSR
ncbi:hypothetical protein [Microbacterium sp. 179-I 3D4 NHS]|uniref:hypothetical protein n=1 Tax=Microbacterium sp. 179-I 3D4 NHS TaxID=3142381 RepID=UPI00399FE7BF